MKLKFIFLITLFCGIMCANAEDITVGLFYDSSAKQELVLSSGDGLSAGELPLGVSVFVKSEGGTVKIYDEARENILTEGEEIVVSAAGDIIKIDDKRYRGGVILRSTDTGIDVINKVDIEKYLYGVVPKEVYASWDEEALKSQAVVARSMVFSSLKNKHASQGFQLCATTNCQVYGGYDEENERTNMAVDATAGLVVKYNGEVAQTFYSSGNGGYTESPENVWSSAIAYLPSKPDPYEQTDEINGLTWTVTVTPQEVADGIAKYGGNVGRVTGMRAAKVAESGRITELEVTGSEGSFTLTKEKTRSFLGLRSQMYTVSGGNSLKALGGDGTVSNAGNTVLGGYGETVVQAIPHALDVTGVIALSIGEDFVLSGRGFGHGIGMSQWGAAAAAEQGMSFEEILGFYYPGTVLEHY